MIHICTSGYGNRSVLRQLQGRQPGPRMYATQYECEDGRIFNGELWAENPEEAELVARALGVEVLGLVVKEVETDGVEKLLRETNDDSEPPG